MEMTCEYCNTDFVGADYNDVGFQFMMHPCDLGDTEE